jgi:hypothetical protein
MNKAIKIGLWVALGGLALAGVTYLGGAVWLITAWHD